MAARPLYERFDEKWMPEPTTGCWLWIAATVQGYGRISLGPQGGPVLAAHRVAYERWVGPIPEGMTIDHVRARGCSTRACVNPEHLEVVTGEENTRRGDAGVNHRRKTHCPQGHPYEGDNLVWRKRSGRQHGGRACRECHRIATKRRRDRLRAGRHRHCAHVHNGLVQIDRVVPRGAPAGIATLRPDQAEQLARELLEAAARARNTSQNGED